MYYFILFFCLTVDNAKRMLGTFSPQKEPYKYEMEEETTPSGLFARGSYSARTKVMKEIAANKLITNGILLLVFESPSCTNIATNCHSMG